MQTLEPAKGFEPLTCGLRNRCSATELRRRFYVMARAVRPSPAVVGGKVGAGATARYFTIAGIIRKTGRPNATHLSKW